LRIAQEKMAMTLRKKSRIHRAYLTWPLVIFLGLFAIPLKTSQADVFPPTKSSFQEAMPGPSLPNLLSSGMTSACLDDSCSDHSNIELILITRPLFLLTLQTSGYLDWKKRQGISTGVFTVEWIMDHFDGFDIAARIKNFIQSMHQLKGTQYAILIGDTELPLWQHTELPPTPPPPPLPGASDPHNAPRTLTNATEEPGGMTAQTNQTIGATFRIEPTTGIKVLDLSAGAIFFSPLLQLQEFTLSRDWEVPTSYFPIYGIAQPPGSDLSDFAVNDLPYASPVNFLTGEPSLGNPQHTQNPYQDPSVDPLVGGETFGIPITVFVARMPVRTVEDLVNILHKTMTVQQIQSLSIFNGDDFDDKKSYEDQKKVCREFLPPDGLQKPDSIQKRDCIERLAGYFLFDKPFLNTVLYITTNSHEAQEHKTLLLTTPPNRMLNITYHGDLQGIYWRQVKPDGSDSDSDSKVLGWEDAKNFSSIFPMYVSYSCAVSAFFYNHYEPTFSEALMRSPTGPAVFSEPLNDYFFYDALSKGKTIGEAQYAGADFAFYGPNPHKFFGDPTLVLYRPPLLPPLLTPVPALFKGWLFPIQLYRDFF
jgi:peptidase C25-like protein